jgi:hypothetical protein
MFFSAFPLNVGKMSGLSGMQTVEEFKMPSLNQESRDSMKKYSRKTAKG